jgi:hypothetical protein
MTLYTIGSEIMTQEALFEMWVGGANSPVAWSEGRHSVSRPRFAQNLCQAAPGIGDADEDEAEFWRELAHNLMDRSKAIGRSETLS